MSSVRVTVVMSMVGMNGGGWVDGGFVRIEVGCAGSAAGAGRFCLGKAMTGALVVDVERAIGTLCTLGALRTLDIGGSFWIVCEEEVPALTVGLRASSIVPQSSRLTKAGVSGLSM